VSIYLSPVNRGDKDREDVRKDREGVERDGHIFRRVWIYYSLPENNETAWITKRELRQAPPLKIIQHFFSTKERQLTGTR